MSQVTIARVAQGFDTLFLNFLNPPLVPPACVGTCDQGISGGHIDVDSDSPGIDDGLGGKTDGHVHEYDDKYDITYVDYFDMEGDGKLYNVTDVGIPMAEEFIVLVANADLSPGGDITLDNKIYNVVKYQRMIHKKLAAWDGVGPLVDDEGVSLIHKLANLQSSDIALRSTFTSLAITGGGLHPTNTGCVNGDTSITLGRWRNGALIFQLVKRSHFIAGTPPLDRVTVQNPSDLRSPIILSDGIQVELTEDLNGNDVIDTGAPDYEVYGGLTVSSNAEFLYESTLFWHYPGGACYGDPGWLLAVASATHSLALAQEALEAAGFADIDALKAELDILEACKGKREKDGGCKDRYKELNELYQVVLAIFNHIDNGGDGDPPTGLNDISGKPVIIDGGIVEGGVTSGPNFETGRRTWIDILPQ
jgi:hypothetical protein